MRTYKSFLENSGDAVGRPTLDSALKAYRREMGEPPDAATMRKIQQVIVDGTAVDEIDVLEQALLAP